MYIFETINFSIVGLLYFIVNFLIPSVATKKIVVKMLIIIIATKITKMLIIIGSIIYCVVGHIYSFYSSYFNIRKTYPFICHSFEAIYCLAFITTLFNGSLFIYIILSIFTVSIVVSYYFLFINFSFVKKHPLICSLLLFVCALIILYSLFIFSSLLVNNVYKIIKILKTILRK